jgi:hypothetical protein
MELNDAWRCDGPCGRMMYNVDIIDGRFYPVEGAPPGFFLSKVYCRVCQVCWDMYTVLDKSDYWKDVQEKDKQKQRKLGRGGNYLAT